MPPSFRSREELDRFWLERINAHLARTGQKSGIKSLAEITSLPFSTKQDLQTQDYRSRWGNVKVARVHGSSGSMGRPSLTPYTANDLNMWAGLVERCLRQAGVREDDVLFVTHGYGLFTGGLGVHAGAERLGCTVVPTSTGQTQRQIELIKEMRATVLVGTPSYLLYLSDQIAEMGLKPSDLKLRLCVCGAEPWSESLRRELESRLNVRAYDLYGLSEIIGPGVASEVEGDSGRLVIWEDHFYPEIVDGELVLTSLVKEALPLLRYRTGDLTTWAGTHKDGIFRCIKRVQARADDMLKIRGVKVFPQQIENVLLSQPGLTGVYVIEVSLRERLDHLLVKVEAADRATIRPEKLRSLLKQSLGISVDVEVCARGVIPTNSGKAKRIFDLRPKS